ncbi:uncharacterized protein LOC144581955 isoform X2 [Callithrix jacchus]
MGPEKTQFQEVLRKCAQSLGVLHVKNMQDSLLCSFLKENQLQTCQPCLRVSLLLPRLECNGAISAHHNLRLLDSGTVLPDVILIEVTITSHLPCWESKNPISLHIQIGSGLAPEPTWLFSPFGELIRTLGGQVSFYH